jgi:hypothetical protein
MSSSNTERLSGCDLPRFSDRMLIDHVRCARCIRISKMSILSSLSLARLKCVSESFVAWLTACFRCQWHPRKLGLKVERCFLLLRQTSTKVSLPLVRCISTLLEIFCFQNTFQHRPPASPKDLILERADVSTYSISRRPLVRTLSAPRPGQLSVAQPALHVDETPHPSNRPPRSDTTSPGHSWPRKQ